MYVSVYVEGKKEKFKLRQLKFGVRQDLIEKHCGEEFSDFNRMPAAVQSRFFRDVLPNILCDFSAKINDKCWVDLSIDERKEFIEDLPAGEIDKITPHIGKFFGGGGVEKKT